jgi:hypothetical protein
MIDKDYQEAVDDIKKALTVLENKPVELDPKPEVKHPDARWHLRVSVAKSLVRIVAGSVLCMGEFFLAGSLLVLAELLGIIEELV